MKKIINKRFTLAFIIAFSIILSTTACQKNTDTPSSEITEFDLSVYENAEDYFITPQNLKAGLNDGSIILYDCNKPDVYEKSHIPGAVGIGFHAFADTTGQPGDPLWGTIVDKKEFEKRLRKIGYDPNKTVVFYSNLFKGPGSDGRAVWQLNLAGLKNARILLGGNTYWEELGYEMTKETSDPYPEYTGEIIIQDYDKTSYTTKEEVFANLGKVPLIDVRTKGEFKGSQKAGEPRGGHITGSEHMLWLDLLEKNGVLKSPEEIEEIMASYNVHKGKDATLY